jgi:hypothetical protein
MGRERSETVERKGISFVMARVHVRPLVRISILPICGLFYAGSKALGLAVVGGLSVQLVGVLRLGFGIVFCCTLGVRCWSLGSSMLGCTKNKLAFLLRSTHSSCATSLTSTGNVCDPHLDDTYRPHSAVGCLATRSTYSLPAYTMQNRLSPRNRTSD